MNTQPPADAAIREALKAHLQISYQSSSDAVVFQELGLCQGRARADLALVNGLIHGYEIKSDRDSLRRLEIQVEIYSKVFDRATLVVGPRHLKAARRMLPGWWGLMRACEEGGSVQICTLREGKRNPRVDPRALVELLWRDQALLLLENRGLDRGIRRQPRQMLWDEISAHYSVEEISQEVRRRLKERATHEAFQPPLSRDE